MFTSEERFYHKSYYCLYADKWDNRLGIDFNMYWINDMDIIK